MIRARPPRAHAPAKEPREPKPHVADRRHLGELDQLRVKDREARALRKRSIVATRQTLLLVDQLNVDALHLVD